MICKRIPSADRPVRRRALRLLAASLLPLLVAGCTTASPGDAPKPAPGPRERVVIVAPHGDDEAIFAGEVLAQYAHDTSKQVSIVFTTDCGAEPAYETTHPAYAADRFAFAKRQLAVLGYDDVRTLGVDDGDDGRHTADKAGDMLQRLRATGLVTAGVELWTISGTGHIDHDATYQAAISMAKEAGLRQVFVYWGYGDTGVIHTPGEGTSVTYFASKSNLILKDRMLAGYAAFFASRYPEQQQALLRSQAGQHDVLSEIQLP